MVTDHLPKSVRTRLVKVTLNHGMHRINVNLKNTPIDSPNYSQTLHCTHDRVPNIRPITQLNNYKTRPAGALAPW